MKKSVIAMLHMGYWLMYLLLILLLFKALNIDNNHALSTGNKLNLLLSPFTLGAILPAIFGFYVAYTILFDRFLEKKKILHLCFTVIVTALVASIAAQLIMYISFGGKRVNWSMDTCITMGIFLAIISLVHIATGLVMKGFISWYNDIKIKAELTKKNYEIELALVKSQINPHFLFNTINNIDVLITKDATKASEYLNKLSDIMRFMLYETKAEKIPLTTELAYIKKFIELQRLRTINEHYINYTVKGDATSLMISPMLFIPFIENAFKHSDNKKVENAITIQIRVEENTITFFCENSYSKNKQLKDSYSGIGNDLIQKRLALLYPKKHTLSITNSNDLYQVNLILQQHEN